MTDQIVNSKEGSESSLVLTEQERARIRAEEVYREEVRKALAKPEKVPDKVFAFLNSPLGIFALSTLLVTGGTFLYSYSKELANKENGRREEIVRLRDEVAFREAELNNILDLVERDGQLIVTRGGKVGEDVDRTASLSLRTECREVAATVRESGLSLPPFEPAKGQDFRLGDIYLSATAFPYQQGYKSSDYKSLSLVDIGLKAWKLENPTNTDGPTQETVSLRSTLHDLDEAALALARSPYIWEAHTVFTGNEPMTNNPREIVQITTPLIKAIRQRFESVRQNRLLNVTAQ